MSKIKNLVLEKSDFATLKTFYKISQQKHIGTALNKKTLEQYKQEFHNARLSYFTVYKDDKIAGYVLLNLAQVIRVQLKRIVLDEKYLGTGVLVLNLVEEYARGLGAKSLWLDVYANNTRAIRLYKKVGFKQYDVGVEGGYEVWFFEKKIQI